MWCRALLLMLILLSGRAAATARYTLQMQPDKCAVSAQSPVCQTQLRISVSGNNAQQLCVRVGEQQQCKQHLPTAPSQFIFSVNTTHSLPVVLSDSQQQALLSLQFLVFQFVEQPQRPRRGYLWNSL